MKYVIAIETVSLANCCYMVFALDEIDPITQEK